MDASNAKGVSNNNDGKKDDISQDVSGGSDDIKNDYTEEEEGVNSDDSTGDIKDEDSAGETSAGDDTKDGNDDNDTTSEELEIRESISIIEDRWSVLINEEVPVNVAATEEAPAAAAAKNGDKEVKEEYGWKAIFGQRQHKLT